MRLLIASLSLLCLIGVSGCGDKASDSGSSNAESQNVTSDSTGGVVDSGGKASSDTAAPTSDGSAKTKKPNKPALATLPLPGEPKLLLSEEEIRDGWIQLFDGQTLAGWTPSSNANWHVNGDGEIEASEGDIGLLLTTVPFADYELKFDYWMGKDGNSGVFLRTLAEPKEVTADCYELNICDSHPEYKTASLVGRAQPTKEVTGEEVWKSMSVRVERNQFTVAVDGEQVLVGPGSAAAGVPAAGTPAAPGAPAALVDLNTADQALLESLPEVGPVTAQAILAWREEHGGFTAVQELLEVDGIGPATLETLAPLVTV